MSALNAASKYEDQTSRDRNSAGFTSFFKSYVNGWVAAAVALPTAITWKGMPVYESQRGILTTYTALSCVLILAYLFYCRAILLGWLKSRIGYFGLLVLPLILICLTGFWGYRYVQILTESAHYAQQPLGDALKSLAMNEIHEGPSLIAYYILTMVGAESALFLMAFREWRR